MQEYGSSTPGSILLLAFTPRFAAGINQSSKKICKICCGSNASYFLSFEIFGSLC